jgi:hypothetical protein
MELTKVNEELNNKIKSLELYLKKKRWWIRKISTKVIKFK